MSTRVALLLTVACIAPAALGQTLLSRYSQIDYSAHYGGGTQFWDPSGHVAKTNLFPFDSAQLGFGDSRSGNSPSDWSATAGLRSEHHYQVDGPLNNFSRISSWSYDDVGTWSTGIGESGAGLSNVLALEFSMAALTPIQITGNVLRDLGRTSSVSLEQWNGTTWSGVFHSTAWLRGASGSFNYRILVGAGTYRIVSSSMLSSTPNQFKQMYGNYVLTLNPVPEPTTLALAGLGLTAALRKRRNAESPRGPV